MQLCFLFLFLLTPWAYADEDVLRPHGRSGIVGPSIRYQGIVRNPWSIGVEVGGTLNFYAEDVTLHQHPQYTTNITGGTGIGPFLALAFDYAVSNHIGLQMRVAYDQKRYSMKGHIDAPCELDDGSTLPARLDRSGFQTLNYWGIGPSIRINLDNWFLIGGLTYHSLIDASGTITDTIISPSNCVFRDDFGNPLPPPSNLKRTQTVNNQSSFRSSRYSFDASLGYRFLLTESIALVPRIGVQLFLTPLAATNELTVTHPLIGNLYTYSNPRLYSLLLCAALWFNI